MPLLRPHGAPYSSAEEAAHAISHGVGAVLALVALPALLVLAYQRQDPWGVVGTAVFGLSMVALYAASTLYHAERRPAHKARWRRLDHAAIYLLIAGTYTPFLLGVLRGPLGWTLLVIQWTIATIGVTVKLRHGAEGRWLSTVLYLAMGWMAAFAARPMVAAIGADGVTWLVAGGLCYTGGVAFYVSKRLRYAHFAWHLCVLAGTACHAVAVVRYAG
ncbi:MAG: hemolysin III family protein [Gemmatimonadaceae bacterium]|nr:hemolysin III family protein [Gemmatimonadaceae bacterium]